MSNFKMKIKFEDRPIFEGKGDNISDFDDAIKCLKEKFKEGKQRRNLNG